MNILIRNGRVLDPSENLDRTLDLRIKDGKIYEIAESLTAEAEERVIDAEGMWVMPGLIDLHVHFRDPGLTHKETIATGSRAAAAGGFTTVCVMPNTKPVTHDASVVRYIHEEAAKTPVTNVLVIGAITKDQAGAELSDIRGMAEAGICGLSEDGKSVMNADLMRQAMQIAAQLGLPILDHCEDANLAHGCMNESEVSRKLGVPGIPGLAEELITARDIQIAEETGARLHICHVSTEGSVKILKAAKELGASVTAEVGPHHFSLDDSYLITGDSNYKMNPPLRGKKDVEVMKEALRSGILDCIATDHAPHHATEKEGGLVKAANGIVGLETSVCLTITELVNKGYLTPLQMADRMSTTPARVLGIEKGTLKPGGVADVVLIDPKASYKIDPETFYTMGRNTPFGGMEVSGKVEMTILGGRVVYENNTIKE